MVSIDDFADGRFFSGSKLIESQIQIRSPRLFFKRGRSAKMPNGFLFSKHGNVANNTIQTSRIQEPTDVRDVFDVPDDEAARRREWILQQLEAGVQPKSRLVASHFKRSKKTAKRDLDAFGTRGKSSSLAIPEPVTTPSWRASDQAEIRRTCVATMDAALDDNATSIVTSINRSNKGRSSRVSARLAATDIRTRRLLRHSGCSAPGHRESRDHLRHALPVGLFRCAAGA